MWWFISGLVAVLAGWLVSLVWRITTQIKVALQGPFYHPASDQYLLDLKKIIKLEPGMKVVDLGSGDGRVLMELAKLEPKIQAVGYEINPQLVKESRKKISAAGLDEQIKIKAESFWTADLADFDVIVVYCVQKFMGRLERQLEEQVVKANVYSLFFQFPTWKPVEQVGDVRLYRNPQAKQV